MQINQGGLRMLVPCAKYCMLSNVHGVIGVQVAHSVADDLNIYYEQCPCVGTPKFQSRKYTNEN